MLFWWTCGGTLPSRYVRYLVKHHRLLNCIQDQAYDRAHRLGQTRDVNIYKLTIPETVETRILQVSLRSNFGDTGLHPDGMNSYKIPNAN